MKSHTDAVIDRIATALVGETYETGVLVLTGCLAAVLKSFPYGEGADRLVTVVKVLKKHILTQDR